VGRGGRGREGQKVCLLHNNEREQAGEGHAETFRSLSGGRAGGKYIRILQLLS
jgi:hypothetical protein